MNLATMELACGDYATAHGVFRSLHESGVEIADVYIRPETLAACRMYEAGQLESEAAFVNVVVASSFSLWSPDCRLDGFLGGCWDTALAQKIDSRALHDEGFSELCHAEALCASSPLRVTGFRLTSVIGDQFRVAPVHRLGFLCFASS